MLRRLAATSLLALAACSGSDAPTGPTPTAEGPFAITPVYVGTTVAPERRAIVERAVARWNSMIRGGPVADDLSLAADACADGAPAWSGRVTGVRLYVEIRRIDGRNGAVAMAGPCVVQTQGGGVRLPLVGRIVIDADDLATMNTATLETVIVHEVGHVLGIGTLWDGRGLLGAGTGSSRFAGSRALAAWRDLGGDRLWPAFAAGVPVEDQGGGGTADGHWRESVFRTELMTGWINPGGVNPLSRMTVMALADLGWRIEPTRIDGYALPTPTAAGVSASRVAGEGREIHDILLEPRYSVPAPQ